MTVGGSCADQCHCRKKDNTHYKGIIKSFEYCHPHCNTQVFQPHRMCRISNSTCTCTIKYLLKSPNHLSPAPSTRLAITCRLEYTQVACVCALLAPSTLQAYEGPAIQTDYIARIHTCSHFYKLHVCMYVVGDTISCKSTNPQETQWSAKACQESKGENFFK